MNNTIFTIIYYSKPIIIFSVLFRGVFFQMVHIFLLFRLFLTDFFPKAHFFLLFRFFFAIFFYYYYSPPIFLREVGVPSRSILHGREVGLKSRIGVTRPVGSWGPL